MRRPPPPVEIPFLPNSPELPRLSSYRGSLGEAYWNLWEISELGDSPCPWIVPSKLYDVARGLHYPNMEEIKSLCEVLSGGPEIGATGAGRLHAEGKNQNSFFEHAFKALDAISTWCKLGLMAGPFTRDRMPDSFRYVLFNL